MKQELTQEFLKEILHYDQGTGIFTWKVSNNNFVKVGDVAGSLNNRGYIVISINGKSFKAHRLAFLYVYGTWPKRVVDHINGEPSDNRIDNLRDVTQLQNNYNLHKLYSSNKTGFRGVSYHSHTGKYQAQITTNGKVRYLGLFDSPEEASSTYQAAKLRRDTEAGLL